MLDAHGWEILGVAWFGGTLPLVGDTVPVEFGLFVSYSLQF